MEMMRKRKSNIRLVSALCFFVMMPVLFVVSVGGTSSDSSQYLYKGNEDALHVIEYDYPENQDEPAFWPLSGSDDKIPSFLASPDYGDRVIEFYAPWCGHCRHFAPKYMEVATNTFETNPEIKFYAVSCTKYKDLCTAMDVHGYPSVKLIGANTKEQRKLDLASIFNEHIDIAKEFSKTDEEREELEENRAILTGKKLDKEDLPISITPKAISSQEDIFSDVSASFYFSLRTGVYTSVSPLDTVQKEALSAWLELLSNTLPKGWEILKVANELLENIDNVSIEEKYLTEILDKYNKEEPEWSTFCKTKSEAQGYTCGLWQLFHVITVGVVEQTKASKQRVPPDAAAYVIRNFVEEFFQCAECVSHFLDMYDSCWNDWCNNLQEEAWESTALWIWDAHNNVNVRLMKEDTERIGNEVNTNDEEKAQWPSRKECNQCWDKDGSYDKNKVFDYLKRTYWPTPGKTVIHSGINLKTEKKTQRVISNITLAFVVLWLMTMWCCFRQVRKILESCSTQTSAKKT